MATSDQPWVEKYRPRTISEVSHQNSAVSMLSAALESGSLPHLLLHGPPGTGKTTCALALVRELFGPQLRATRVLELNASDERGIAVVREKIKGFAAGAVSKTSAQGTMAAGGRVETGTRPRRPPPPFKVIILDEADSMTVDAQAALRRTMETYCKVTRFIILCNYVSRIIEPLASRCAKFRFEAVRGEALEQRVAFVAEKEQVRLQDGAMEAIVGAARGDVRRALTALQGAARLGSGEVTSEGVRNVIGAVPPEAAAALLVASKSGSFDMLRDAVLDCVAEGYPIQELLLMLQELVLTDESLPELVRANVLISFAATDKALNDGADETLQLLGSLSNMQTAIAGAA